MKSLHWCARQLCLEHLNMKRSAMFHSMKNLILFQNLFLYHNFSESRYLCFEVKGNVMK